MNALYPIDALLSRSQPTYLVPTIAASCRFVSVVLPSNFYVPNTCILHEVVMLNSLYHMCATSLIRTDAQVAPPLCPATDSDLVSLV